MSYSIRTRDRHLANDGSPKRILALDGGGLRGILSLGLLQKIENVLRERHQAGDDFRLSHYFDLIAGTSTGANIAATLALGWTVEAIRTRYMALGERVFTRSLLRQGVLRAKYDDVTLIAELKKVYVEAEKLRTEGAAAKQRITQLERQLRGRGRAPALPGPSRSQ